MSGIKSIDDPFDLSQRDSTIEKLGVASVQAVADLEENARVLYQTAKNSQAAEALETFARQANWLSNIIGATLAPYYNAAFDEQEHNSTDIEELVELERRVNEYRAKRNTAMVMRAECLLAEGKREQALALLMEALDLIDIGDSKLWKRARSLINTMVGIVGSTKR